jgi:Tol biopolymer transport system component
MPDVQEVFRVATQKVRPDPGALERQHQEQRRRSTRRKVGALALAAVLVSVGVLLAVGLFSNGRSKMTPGVRRPTTGPTKPGTEQMLSIVDVNSGDRTAFRAPLGASGFDFTPDGSMVTYTDVDENGIHQVFVMGADGSNRKQLTHGTLGVTPTGTPPQWSPDGSRIAYWAFLPGSGIEIFVVRVSDGVSTRVTNEPKDVYEGGWASDRSFVFSISNAASAYPLLARSIVLETGKTATIARDVSTPEVSPDGTQIAFDSYFRPQGEAWLSLMNIDGTSRKKIQHVSYNGSYPKWSPDGTKIAYVDSPADGVSGTYIYDLATGVTRFLTAGRIESWIDNDHVLMS